MRYFFVLQSILLIMVSSSSAPVGDFSPLEIGNTWVYSYSSDTTSTLYKNFSSHSSKIITIQVTEVREMIDTIYYRLRTCTIGSVVVDTGSLQGPKTIVIDTVEYTTIYETDGVIMVLRSEGDPYPLDMPILGVHIVESETVIVPSIISRMTGRDGVYELYIERVGHMDSDSRVYVTDTGLVSSYSSTSLHGHGARSTLVLISFTRAAPIVETGVQLKSRLKKNVIEKKSTTSLVFPYINVIKGNNVFNLMGRAYKSALYNKNRTLSLRKR